MTTPPVGAAPCRLLTGLGLRIEDRVDRAAACRRLALDLLTHRVCALHDLRIGLGSLDPELDRKARLLRETGNPDRSELVQRLIVRDATDAVTTTTALYFGSYGFGGP